MLADIIEGLLGAISDHTNDFNRVLEFVEFLQLIPKGCSPNIFGELRGRQKKIGERKERRDSLFF